jgi:hypothetical protein
VVTFGVPIPVMTPIIPSPITSEGRVAILAQYQKFVDELEEVGMFASKDQSWGRLMGQLPNEPRPAKRVSTQKRISFGYLQKRKAFD